MVNEKRLDDWDQLLNPELVRRKLIEISVFITVFELFSDSVTSRVSGFYMDANDPLEDASVEYLEKVLMENGKRKKEEVQCLKWLLRHGAIDDSDFEALQAIKSYRNRIAHEPFRMLADSNANVDSGLLSELLRIYRKVTLWWIVEVDPMLAVDFDEIDPDELSDTFSIDWWIASHIARLMPDVKDEYQSFYEEWRRLRAETSS